MSRATQLILVLLASTLAAPLATRAQCSNPAAAAAADALATNFDKHQFILIGSTHGDAKIEEFLRCLISRPAFTQFVYLGPEPDRDLTGSIALSAEQERELARRNTINSDPQRSMRAISKPCFVVSRSSE